jgi:flagellin
MIINHNMSALFAQRQQKLNSWVLDKNMEKLSSGLRITRAGDDASGLAVSEKMRSQIRGLNRAEKNAMDGISFIQTTEGYLQESQDIIQRLRELAVQAANGIYADEDRMQIQVEVSSLVDEVDRIASHAQFNGMNLLTGRFARESGENIVTASMWFHVGANMDQRVRVYIGTMTSEGLGLKQQASKQIISVSTPDQANRAIGLLDEALKQVNKHAPTWAPTRTGWSSPPRAWPSARRTCRPQKAASATRTWPSRWWSSPRTRSCCSRPRPCWPRPT